MSRMAAASHLPVGLTDGAHLQHAVQAVRLVEGRVDDARVLLPQSHSEPVHLRAVQPVCVEQMAVLSNTSQQILMPYNSHIALPRTAN